MLTIRSALQQGTQLLDDGHIAAPRLTAEVLLCHALRRERVYLYAHPEEELTELAWIHYGRYLHQRLHGVPTQYITKTQEFFGRPFFVSPAVLIPRPETEHLVEAVLRVAPDGGLIADIGCGSGAIAISIKLEKPSVRVIAADISFDALRVAAHNAEKLQSAIAFFRGDLLSSVRDASLDVVASNPPYVPLEDRSALQAEVRDHEPSVALYGGPTGNEIYAQLIPQAACVLKPGGWLAMELGYRSLDAVRAMFDSRWSQLESLTDLAGIPRVFVARLTP